jgi:hypothetical protein
LPFQEGVRIGAWPTIGGLKYTATSIAKLLAKLLFRSRAHEIWLLLSWLVRRYAVLVRGSLLVDKVVLMIHGSRL